MKKFAIHLLLFIIFLGLVFAVLYFTNNLAAFMSVVEDVKMMVLDAIEKVKLTMSIGK